MSDQLPEFTQSPAFQLGLPIGAAVLGAASPAAARGTQTGLTAANLLSNITRQQSLNEALEERNLLFGRQVTALEAGGEFRERQFDVGQAETKRQRELNIEAGKAFAALNPAATKGIPPEALGAQIGKLFPQARQAATPPIFAIAEQIDRLDQIALSPSTSPADKTRAIRQRNLFEATIKDPNALREARQRGAVATLRGIQASISSMANLGETDPARLQSLREAEQTALIRVATSSLTSEQKAQYDTELAEAIRELQRGSPLALIQEGIEQSVSDVIVKQILVATLPLLRQRSTQQQPGATPPAGATRRPSFGPPTTGGFEGI